MTQSVSSLAQLLDALTNAAEQRLQNTRGDELIVSPDVSAITEHLKATYDFEAPVPHARLFADVLTMLRTWDLDSTHPRYFGLFNPPALPITVAADALVAMFNPQVGTHTHAPGANQIEQHVLRFLSERIGFDASRAHAHFTSGGQEANTTAIATALTHHFPDVAEEGLQSLGARPVLYASQLAHHSIQKAARLLGLGDKAVRSIPADEDGCMRVAALHDKIVEDRNSQFSPFLVVATAGTTSIGSIDPLARIAGTTNAEGLSLHVDAAWAGTALLSPHLRQYLSGIEKADSVTWDAHKWMDVPMGAGMVFFSGDRAPASTFHADTGYVPSTSNAEDLEPYQSTFQWSRRLMGLKVFMALASLSAGGYAQMLDAQVRMGNTLRHKLANAGWKMVNNTPLPLVCFTDPVLDQTPDAPSEFATRLQRRGRVWISSVTTHSGAALRACITSFDTNDEDLEVLIDELETCRSEFQPENL